MADRKKARVGIAMARKATTKTRPLEDVRLLKERLDCVPDWVSEVNLDGVITYSNRVVRELLGYTQRNVIGTSIFDIMVEEDVHKSRELFGRAVASGEPVTNIATRFRAKNSSIRNFEVSCVPMRDADGGLVGFRGIARDVTERKRAEDRLNRLTQTLLGFDPDPIENINRLTALVGELTNASCALYNRLDEGMLCSWGRWQTPPDYNPVDTPDGHICYDVIKRGGPDLLVVRNLPETPYAVTDPNVARYGLQTYIGQAVGFAGEYVGSLCAVFQRDIVPSEEDEWLFSMASSAIGVEERRKTAEDALLRASAYARGLIEASLDPLVTFDADGRITDVNKATEEVTGLSRERLIGSDFPDYFTEPEKAREGCEQAFSQGQVKDYPLAIRHVSGRTTDVLYNATVYYDQQGEAKGVFAAARDITERKRSEEQLRESREMLQLVMNNIPQFIFWKDINSVYLGCNEIFAGAAGLASAAEIVGKTDCDLPWGKAEADWYRDWDRRVMSSDKPAYHIDETQLTPDGITIIVDTNKVPLHDAGGKVVGILGTYEDVTERRQGEQALQEAEAKYRSLVEETMVGVYVIQDDQFVYANPRMLEILGARAEDVLGKSPLEFTAPQDRALVAENIRKRMRGEIKSIRYAFKALRKDGTPVDVESLGTVTTFMGRPAIIGSLADITERKRYVEALQDSEERYRRLFEHSPDLVFLVSARTSTFIAMNPAVTQVLGYAPYDVLGRSPWDISPEFQPDGQPSKEKAEKLLADQPGAPAQRFEWVHKRKDGSLADCELSLVAYRFHGEDLIQAIVRDVTERKRAEENRRKLERDLECQKRSFYRETILSVTGGKLDICDWPDVEPFVVRAKKSVEVDDASQVAKARREVERFCLEHGLEQQRLHDFAVGVGEAVTNAIKHGVHGSVHVGGDDESVWVVASDQGSGIESLILPRAVLLRGFSTKPSLGLGYSIMLEVCDRILLCTGESGTTVVLIKQKAEQDLALTGEHLPDTWNGIRG